MASHDTRRGGVQHGKPLGGGVIQRVSTHGVRYNSYIMYVHRPDVVVDLVLE